MKETESSAKVINIFEYIKGEKGKKILIIAGIVALLFIFISDFFPKGTAQDDSATKTMTSGEYTAMLEERLTDIISNISGTGKATVMVTLESGTEYIYESEQKKNTDITQDTDGDSNRTQQRDDTEEKAVVVDDPGGGKQALVRTEIEPKIKGVVIVCEGGEQELVQQRVIDAVTTVLNISSRRVCVTKLS